MCAQFGTDASSEPEVLGIAHQLLAHSGDCHGGDAVAIPGVDNFAQIADRLVLVHATDVDLHRQRRSVQANRIIDIDGDQFVRKFLENALASARPQHNRPGDLRRNCAAQGAARHHQRVGVGNQRHDGDVDALQAGGRTLKVTVIDRQHHGSRIVGIEDARQAVFHPPVQRVAPLDPARGARVGYIEIVVFAVLHMVKICHCSLLL